MTVPPPGTGRLLLHVHRGKPVGQLAVSWAEGALMGSFDTPSLRELAGLDLKGRPNSFEALPLIRASLQEMGVAEPDVLESAQWYVTEIARAVVAGSLPPNDAADMVCAEVVCPLEFPSELMDWCHAWDGLGPGYEELSPDERARGILVLAKEWAERGSSRAR